MEPDWLKPLSLPRSIVTFHLVIRTLVRLGWLRPIVIRVRIFYPVGTGWTEPKG